jgi:hypothetical protein
VIFRQRPTVAVPILDQRGRAVQADRSFSCNGGELGVMLTTWECSRLEPERFAPRLIVVLDWPGAVVAGIKAFVHVLFRFLSVGCDQTTTDRELEPAPASTLAPLNVDALISGMC